MAAATWVSDLPALQARVQNGSHGAKIQVWAGLLLPERLLPAPRSPLPVHSPQAASPVSSEPHALVRALW